MKQNRDSGELSEHPPVSRGDDLATTTKPVRNPPGPKPRDPRWLPLLNEVEDSPGRHDVYDCPRAADRQSKS
jgi:hypothetical protein